MPRAMVRPITERIDVDGDVIVPLDEDGVRDAVRDLVVRRPGAHDQLPVVDYEPGP